MAAHHPQQLVTASQACHQLGAELPLVGTIPAVNNGALILEELREIRRGTTQMQAQMQAQMVQMQGQMGEVQGEIGQVQAQLRMIRVEQSAERTNNIARLQNSRIRLPTDQLSVLYSYRTNNPIPEFPPSPNGILLLTGFVLNRILRALELDIGGTMEDRREKLRSAIGGQYDHAYSCVHSHYY